MYWPLLTHDGKVMVAYGCAFGFWRAAHIPLTLSLMLYISVSPFIKWCYIYLPCVVCF